MANTEAPAAINLNSVSPATEKVEEGDKPSTHPLRSIGGWLPEDPIQVWHRDRGIFPGDLEGKVEFSLPADAMQDLGL